MCIRDRCNDEVHKADDGSGGGILRLIVDLHVVQFLHQVGHGGGFKGRMGLFEIFEIDDEVRRMINENLTSPQLLSLIHIFTVWQAVNLKWTPRKTSSRQPSRP